MRLGPIFIGWRLLSSAELSEFELPNDRPWQGWCVEWFGPEYRAVSLPQYRRLWRAARGE